MLGSSVADAKRFKVKEKIDPKEKPHDEELPGEVPSRASSFAI
jgi:hypothetical protein